MNYLIIFEGGSLYCMNELTNAELEAYNEGILDIIAHNENGFHQYVNGEFEPIKIEDND